VNPEVMRLVETEEARMRRDAAYRSSRQTLRKLARSYIVFESADARSGAWDRFTIRNLCLAGTERGWDSVLPRIAEARRWPARDKAVVKAILRAKSGPDESHYLRLMQQCPRLRAAVLELGSRS
jgi:hypothetical protein